MSLLSEESTAEKSSWGRICGGLDQGAVQQVEQGGYCRKPSENGEIDDADRNDSS